MAQKIDVKITDPTVNDLKYQVGKKYTVNQAFGEALIRAGRAIKVLPSLKTTVKAIAPRKPKEEPDKK